MDHFEQELARLMRDSGAPGEGYEDRHRRRLYAGVRARQRTRRAWMATGSALTIAALGAVLMTLPDSFAQNGPGPRNPRPATSAGPLPTHSTADGAPIPAHTSSTVPVASPRHPSPSGGTRTT
ncbi:cellulase [Streptomyces sp. NPDC057280]|uniref:cellulase n=1 Tax=Streptomyces sp. NPDC057280 TaxID=3346081 RepID=UPI0036333251